MSIPFIQFKLAHLFYITAVLASSVSVFGSIVGWFIGGSIILFWGCYGELRKRHAPITSAVVRDWLTIGLVLIVMTSFFLPLASGGATIDSQRGDSRLYPIQYAIKSYCAMYGAMPPRVVCDSSGQPLHSWRALLLPYFGVMNYRMDEPWDSAHNLGVVEEHRLLLSLSDEGLNSILAVYGEDTAWSKENAIGFGQALGVDGEVPAVICLVVSENHQVGWAEPRDLPIERLDELLVKPHTVNSEDWDDGFFTQQFYGRSYGTAVVGEGGRFRFDEPDYYRRLTQLSKVNDASDQFNEQRAKELHRRRFRHDNVIRLFFLMGIAVLPRFVLFYHSRGDIGRHESR